LIRSSIFLNSPFLKTVGLLSSGSALSQLVQILIQPLLARIYDVSQFGTFAQVNAIGSIVAVVGTLQMHQAIVLPRNENESADLFAAGFLSSTIISLISFFLLTIYKVNLFGLKTYALLPLFCSILSLVLCYGNLLRGWQTARGSFKILSIGALIRAVTIVFFQAIMGLLKIDYGLIYGILFGEVATSIIFVLTKHSPNISKTISSLALPKKLFSNIKNYHQFAFAGTIQELISVTALMLPMFMFTRAYGSEVGGQYAMASRFAWAPLLLIGNALSQVTLHHFSGIDPKDLRKSSMLNIGKNAVIILLVAVLIALMFPIILPLILGNRWMIAGKMGMWIVFWAAAFLISTPYRICYRILRCQFFQLMVDASILIIFLILFFKFSDLNPIMMIAIIAFIGFLQNALLIFIMRFKLQLDNN
jgi:O-antigen/teichoic acid export membrane protein